MSYDPDLDPADDSDRDHDPINDTHWDSLKEGNR